MSSVSSVSRMSEQDIIDSAKSKFEQFDKSMVSLTFARNKGDIAKTNVSKEIQKEILDSVNLSSDEVQDCFWRLLIAEYKEYLYGSLFDPCFERVEQGILSEYDEFLRSDNQMFDKVLNHKHEPEYFIFYDRQSNHQFYDFVENKGYSIIRLSDSQDALQEFYENT